MSHEEDIEAFNKAVQMGDSGFSYWAEREYSEIEAEITCRKLQAEKKAVSVILSSSLVLSVITMLVLLLKG